MICPRSYHHTLGPSLVTLSGMPMIGILLGLIKTGHKQGDIGWKEEIFEDLAGILQTHLQLARELHLYSPDQVLDKIGLIHIYTKSLFYTTQALQMDLKAGTLILRPLYSEVVLV